MFFALLVALAAQSADQSPPPDSPPAAERPGPGEGRGFARQQIFIAPSGQLFTAAPDAPYPVANWFARANGAHDGKLTQAEFTADFLRFARSIDLNGDGVIDSSEVKAYEANVASLIHRPNGGGWHRPDGGGPDGGGPNGGGGEGHGHRGGDNAGGANRPQGEARFGLLPLPEPVSAMDTAGDGRITRAEVEAAAASRFAQLDGKHQGYLTLADLPQTFAQQMRERMREHMGHGGGAGGGFGGPGDGGGGASLDGLGE